MLVHFLAIPGRCLTPLLRRSLKVYHKLLMVIRTRRSLSGESRLLSFSSSMSLLENIQQGFDGDKDEEKDSDRDSPHPGPLQLVIPESDKCGSPQTVFGITSGYDLDEE